MSAARINCHRLKTPSASTSSSSGSALVMNTYFQGRHHQWPIVALGLLALASTIKVYGHLKPLVIRIDDVGRAQAVEYDTLTYQPQGQAPELKYFLTQFVTTHFARMRATVKERYAESLYFFRRLEPGGRPRWP